VFTLRFSDEETLGNLKRTAAALGVSTTELAEAAIERELTLVGSDQEHRLARALDRLRSAGPTDLDQDIQSFARDELEVEDPLRAYRVEARNQAQAEAGDQGELLGGKIDQTFTAILHRLGVPTREEIRNLTRRVEELHATIELLRPRVTPAAPAARETPAANKSAGKRSATPSSRGHS
jgi:Poly(hydroxyalcanoate) granule associated protein (phasin)